MVIIDGTPVIPCRKRAWDDYKNECRKQVISYIEEANREQEYEVYIENKLDKWLIKELEERGYDVELVSEINYRNGVGFKVTNTKISWVMEEEIDDGL